MVRKTLALKTDRSLHTLTKFMSKIRRMDSRTQEGYCIGQQLSLWIGFKDAYVTHGTSKYYCRPKTCTAFLRWPDQVPYKWQTYKVSLNLCFVVER